MTIEDTSENQAALINSGPVVDAEEAARQRAKKIEKVAGYALPIGLFVFLIGFWEYWVKAAEIPHYILPSPSLIIAKLFENLPTLWISWWTTFRITQGALVLAMLGGGGLAVLFTQSRRIEQTMMPYVIVLQVTPIIAIAPLIFLYIDSHIARVLFVAWIVAFFPILSNSALGLKSTDHNLNDLFSIYGASRWQRLRHLQLPSALPSFLGGMRIAGGLALIGAVVAEFTMGSGGQASGLAFRILEASYRLKVPDMFAALVLIILTGVAIYLILAWVTWKLLHKWHESAITRE